jgi:hypothetical protein
LLRACRSLLLFFVFRFRLSQVLLLVFRLLSFSSLEHTEMALSVWGSCKIFGTDFLNSFLLTTIFRISVTTEPTHFDLGSGNKKKAMRIWLRPPVLWLV